MPKLLKNKIIHVLRALMPSAMLDAHLRSVYCRNLGLSHFAADKKYRIYGCRFGKHCRLGGSCVLRDCTFGDYSYAESGVRITQTDIGSFCSIGPGAMIGLAGHPVQKFASTHPAFYLYRPELSYDFVKEDVRSDYTRTRLGSDVWVGANAMIKDGVSIGDGAIVGAGAVVTKDVEPYTIVAGVPARLLRKRFDDNTIKALLEIQWWSRGDAWLREHIGEMADVDHLVAIQQSQWSTTSGRSEHSDDGDRHGVS